MMCPRSQVDLYGADTKASEAAAKELVERAKVEAAFWGSEWGSGGRGGQVTGTSLNCFISNSLLLTLCCAVILDHSFSSTLFLLLPASSLLQLSLSLL
jgi:hypothetical protein